MITAARIQLQFIGCPHIILPDESYATPTLHWLQGLFWEWFRAARWSHNLDRWTRKNDCDNFARAYAQAAQDCHAGSHGSDAEALAVGEYFYQKAGAGGHAIVAAFVGDPAELVFIEPQSNQLLDLTPAERASAFFVRF